MTICRLLQLCNLKTIVTFKIFTHKKLTRFDLQMKDAIWLEDEETWWTKILTDYVETMWPVLTFKCECAVLVTGTNRTSRNMNDVILNTHTHTHTHTHSQMEMPDLSKMAKTGNLTTRQTAPLTQFWPNRRARTYTHIRTQILKSYWKLRNYSGKTWNTGRVKTKTIVTVWFSARLSTHNCITRMDRIWGEFSPQQLQM